MDSVIDSVSFTVAPEELKRITESKLCAKKINEIDKTLQALGSPTSFSKQILTNQPLYKSFIVYFSIFLHMYGFMIEFLLVIEFYTIIRCIKSEFQKANKLLEDNNVQSSVTKELIEQRKLHGSLSTESLFTQSRLKTVSHKINRTNTLLRTIRQVHLELYRVSKRFSNMYGIQISLEIGMCVMLETYVLYRFYAKYREKTYDINELTLEFIHAIFLCLQYSIKIFIINYICDKTRKEAERTNEIIHTFNGKNVDCETQKEVEIFSLQMMQCPNAYSAYVYWYNNDVYGYHDPIYYSILFYIFKDVLDIFKGVYGTDVRLKLFIEQLEICTREIDELNISRTYSSSFRYQCFTGVFLIFLIFNLIACDIYWLSHIRLSIDYSLMFQFCYFDSYPLIVMLVIDFTFVFWIRQIKFAQLNAILQSMLTTTIDSPQHKRVLRMKDNWENDSSLSTIYRMYKANENLVKLKRIKQIHLELMKCARIIMEAYGIPIIMSITISIIFTIMLLYCLFTVLFINEYQNWRNESFPLYYWIGFYVIKIFIMNNICETTMVEIRNFIFQLTQNRLTFTACGFYDLNHTFIYSVIGWITTYFVILIQVGDKPKLFKNEMLDVSVRVKTTKVGRIVTKFRFINNAFVYIIAIFVGLSKRKRIKLFIEQLETCTREIDELNIPRNYSSFFRYQCIIGLFIIFIILGLIIDNLYWYADINLPFNYILTLQYYYFDNYPYIVTMVIDFTFVFWIRYIKIKFGQLNAVLQNMLTTTIDFPQHKRVLRMKDNWEDDSLLSTIYQIYKGNENLVKLKRINLYSISISNNYDNWMNEFYSHFYWIFYFAIKIFAINNICETTMAEIRDFTFQLIQNRLTFTAYGFYDLDHTFICSAIGSITTYLLILIQLDEPKIFFNDTNYNSTSRI
ncbi:gustatory receptor for sugar taste 43a-like [Vespula maculifrons]|uniref:Gustatory receptor for sugar taste 43a-like n=1 Tax=Vespula maculifrons TaxID=7453 RepID=A0ABD2CNY1_VESMC